MMKLSRRGRAPRRLARQQCGRCVVGWAWARKARGAAANAAAAVVLVASAIAPAPGLSKSSGLSSCDDRRPVTAPPAVRPSQRPRGVHDSGGCAVRRVRWACSVKEIATVMTPRRQRHHAPFWVVAQRCGALGRRPSSSSSTSSTSGISSTQRCDAVAAGRAIYRTWRLGSRSRSIRR